MSIRLTYFAQQMKRQMARRMAVSQSTAADDFKDAIELLFFAYRDFIADPDEILAAHGFGRAHHRVLHFVATNPGMSIADLLDLLRVTKQSLARVLRDLIDEGYVEQRIGEHDRRKRLLFLTDAGHALHGQLIAPQISRFAQVFDICGAAEFEQWKATTRLLINSQDREDIDRLVARAPGLPPLARAAAEKALRAQRRAEAKK